ncbi:hypothetical protein QBC46DRAFT_376577 [Diplogelasinospora grovesii]|uniref:Telomerase reverse transcriptase n=1 Tax=Diplogelasinospora grovesii TaxID=303347 RepID=A0AAN6S751_9PEZI|nr:hypothetical protein QBC46DRAFT_376577 [Diplogelasinospora grovesii]
MFFDTSHNTQQTVLANAYTAFVETATKMWAYARCLPRGKQPSARLVIDTIKNLVEIAFSLLNSKSRRLRYPEYRCNVRKTQLSWIAMVACRQVLTKKQTGYKDVLTWLEEETRKVSIQKGVNCELLVRVVQGVNPTTTVSKKR